MIKKQLFTYFNDEWNNEPNEDKVGIKSYLCNVSNEPTTDYDYGDEDFISNVDFIEDKKAYNDYDDDGGYEEYGN